jgi:hypothetical protein
MTFQQVIQPSSKVKEIIFVVEEDIEGGYFAQALGKSIFTLKQDLFKPILKLKKDHPNF